MAVAVAVAVSVWVTKPLKFEARSYEDIDQVSKIGVQHWLLPQHTWLKYSVQTT